MECGEAGQSHCQIIGTNVQCGDNADMKVGRPKMRQYLLKGVQSSAKQRALGCVVPSPGLLWPRGRFHATPIVLRICGQGIE